MTDELRQRHVKIGLWVIMRWGRENAQATEPQLAHGVRISGRLEKKIFHKKDCFSFSFGFLVLKK